jgi:hypothetical protein
MADYVLPVSLIWLLEVPSSNARFVVMLLCTIALTLSRAMC